MSGRVRQRLRLFKYLPFEAGSACGPQSSRRFHLQSSPEELLFIPPGNSSLAKFFERKEIFMSDGFKDSPEYDDWIESGGRDEDYSDYYNKWHRRVNR